MNKPTRLEKVFWSDYPKMPVKGQLIVYNSTMYKVIDVFTKYENLFKVHNLSTNTITYFDTSGTPWEKYDG